MNLFEQVKGIVREHDKKILNSHQRAYLISNLLRPSLQLAAEDDSIDFDTVERDCFDPRSGHTTRPTGEYYMTFVVDGETKNKIEKIIKGAKS